MGLVDFTEPYLIDAPYLDGVALDLHRPIAHQDIEESPGVLLLTAHSGKTIVQKRHRGTKAPDAHIRYRFTLELSPSTQAVWEAFKGAWAKAKLVWFTTGGRCTDVFQVTPGSVHTLYRPLAEGTVPGVTAGTHPVKLVLNGSVDAAAATFSGSPKQTMTTAVGKTGELVVHYTPVHRVVITGFSENHEDYNIRTAAVEIEEAIQGSFA